MRQSAVNTSGIGSRDSVDAALKPQDLGLSYLWRLIRFQARTITHGGCGRLTVARGRELIVDGDFHRLPLVRGSGLSLGVHLDPDSLEHLNLPWRSSGTSAEPNSQSCGHESKRAILQATRLNT